MSMPPAPRRRVLIVDDNLSIHDDFRRILTPVHSGVDLDAEADALLGVSAATCRPASVGADFELVCASQGEEGRDKLIASRLEAQPFALAFVDMRMPPGWDGLTTILRMWDVDPEVHVVICTAHSERTWDEIAATLTRRDRWAVLKKPFDKVEVLQLAHVMTSKWQLAQCSGRGNETCVRSR